MYMKELRYLLIGLGCLLTQYLSAQEAELRRVFIDGKVYPVLITGGDTMIIADLGTVTVKSKRIFASKDRKTFIIVTDDMPSKSILMLLKPSKCFVKWNEVLKR
ncbi:MAG: hypothetical protein IPJ06_19350 [Saprospiraceae bacterium]|nr:hypothetical protein [Saprospiraceae bacterium]